MKISLKPFLKPAIVAFIFAGLVACSKDVKNRNAEESIAAYIQENKNIVGFGHVDGMTILNKMEYKQIPQLNGILSSVIGQWEKGFDLKKPIYFAVEAPFDSEGNPAKTVAFINVKDEKEVKNAILDMQYSLEKTGDIEYYQENDVTFGFRKKLFIAIVKGGEYDGKAAIEEAFKQAEGEEGEGKTASILAEKGDLVAGVNLERLFLTSNTKLNKINADKKAELEGLVADAFISTKLNFNKGEIRIESKNLFSDALKDRLPYEDNNGKSLYKKLGGGDAWFGMAYNMNMHKAEDFLTDFMPFAREELNNQLPDVVKFGLMGLGNNPYAKLISGQMGIVATGNAQMEMGMPLEMSAFIGLGQQSDLITNMLKEQVSGMPKNGDAYQMGEYNIRLKKEGVYVSSGPNSARSLKTPEFAKDFGTKSFTLFVHFSKMNMASFELDDAAKIVEELDYAYATADKNGALIVISAKNKKLNILKIASDYYVQELMDKM